MENESQELPRSGYEKTQGSWDSPGWGSCYSTISSDGAIGVIVSVFLILVLC